ncbi:MAG: ribosomal RNA small subunit methyltransferase A [Candidatus Portnoybacteria bacterium CG10_big_fil_rev_8_21_14_0_10_36_7]|uniref:Ribosomal RNA small subunit methyltransferase A n=1 Tax=Candidatus Portnoybacteria bacterium CG10_big_fil_rev_8_21_14_0_10_36_7 TaxID=1974812 RepID=A0A2M8KEF8_9BACT|nr:MAG: ribosomal RNA small subunit methyltransferase A [Candidatus Portnoybacteria bacterium CG10_big_fil_rev_8_21_14_0_10_36_7]
MMPTKKHLGQNFLNDPEVSNKIIELANIEPSDTILEIGPGYGVLTQEIINRAKKVIAVEKDQTLIPKLQKKFQGHENLEIIMGDILKIFPTLTLSSYKVVANIPYYLTAYLLRLILENPNPPQQMTLMLQKEVAERICGSTPNLTLLAVSAQYFSEPTYCLTVKKKSFNPIPKVDSAILQITNIVKKNEKERTDFFKIVRAGFSQPRKLAINNLSSKLELSKNDIIEIFNKLGINQKTRPQEISVSLWKKITGYLAY